MYLFTFHASPCAAHQDFHTVAGAYINSWVTADTLEGAERVARDHITNCDWFIKGLDMVSEVSEDDYDAEDDNYEYFKLANEGEDIFVFNTYPLK